MRAVKPLGQVKLGTSLTTIYQPAGSAPFLAVVTSLWLCNLDSANRAVTLRYGTGTLTDLNSLGESWDIEAHKTWIIVFDEDGLSIPLNYLLQGSTDSADKITATAFGYEEA